MDAPATRNSGNSSDDLPPRKTSPLRLIFRIVRWTTYVAAAITLLMVFHAAPPPVVATSPQAAARVEQKVEAVEQAVASGQPATLRLDQTELNSYLASHLDISPTAAATPPPHPAPRRCCRGGPWKRASGGPRAGRGQRRAAPGRTGAALRLRISA